MKNKYDSWYYKGWLLLLVQTREAKMKTKDIRSVNIVHNNRLSFSIQFVFLRGCTMGKISSDTRNYSLRRKLYRSFLNGNEPSDKSIWIKANELTEVFKQLYGTKKHVSCILFYPYLQYTKVGRIFCPRRTEHTNVHLMSAITKDRVRRDRGTRDKRKRPSYSTFLEPWYFNSLNCTRHQVQMADCTLFLATVDSW